MSKNIIICCDGTQNQFAGDSTNVLRLYRMLNHADQHTYYDPGVGTRVDPTAMTQTRRWLWKKLDAAIGHSLRDHFCSAYTYLARVYSKGDRVFLFGFSRGAYTVRALAGALHQFGLIAPENLQLAPYLWATYANDDDALTRDVRFAAAARFRKVFSSDEFREVDFVGVWDTVSSLGWIWDYRTLPYTANNPSIRVARHAVAIDELRACFVNNMFGPGDSADEPLLAADAADQSPTESQRDWKQVWFPGSHGDVGGGYPDHEAGLSKVTLRWMYLEAKKQGVLFDDATVADMLGDDDRRKSKPNPLGPMHDESHRWSWRVLEFVPRRTWSSFGVSADSRKSRGAMGWRPPHLWARRKIPEYSILHESVRIRMADTASRYAPALPLRFSYWNDDQQPVVGNI